jgi:hypothetical protein
MAGGSPGSVFRSAQSTFVIAPRIVHKVDALVDRGMDDAHPYLRIGVFADVVPSHADRRHPHACRTQYAGRNAVDSLHLSLLSLQHDVPSARQGQPLLTGRRAMRALYPSGAWTAPG